MHLSMERSSSDVALRECGKINNFFAFGDDRLLGRAAEHLPAIPFEGLRGQALQKYRCLSVTKSLGENIAG